MICHDAVTVAPTVTLRGAMVPLMSTKGSVVVAVTVNAVDATLFRRWDAVSLESCVESACTQKYHVPGELGAVAATLTVALVPLAARAGMLCVPNESAPLREQELLGEKNKAASVADAAPAPLF